MTRCAASVSVGFAGDLVSALHSSARIALARGDVDSCGGAGRGGARALPRGGSHPRRRSRSQPPGAGASTSGRRSRVACNSPTRAECSSSRPATAAGGRRRSRPGRRASLAARRRGRRGAGAHRCRRHPPASGVELPPVAAAEHLALVGAVREALAEAGDPPPSGGIPTSSTCGRPPISGAAAELRLRTSRAPTTAARPVTARPVAARPLATRSTGDPTTGGPTTGDPTTDGPTTGGPTTDGPTTDDPTTDDPTTGDPTTGDPTTDDPTTDGPTTGDRSTDGPTTDGPTTDGPTTDGPTTDGPTTGDPTTGDPTTDGPTRSARRPGHAVGRRRPVRDDQAAARRSAAGVCTALGVGRPSAASMSSEPRALGQRVARRQGLRARRQQRLHLVGREVRALLEEQGDRARHHRGGLRRAGAPEEALRAVAGDAALGVVLVDVGARVAQADDRPARRDQIGVAGLRRRGSRTRRPRRRRSLRCPGGPTRPRRSRTGRSAGLVSDGVARPSLPAATTTTIPSMPRGLDRVGQGIEQ